MAESISYIKLGNQEHPIDAVTVNGLSFTSEEKTRWDNKQDALTFDSIPTENSENPVKSGGVYDMIVDNEYVISTALNDLNDRMLNVEESMSSVLVSETDPVFSASPAASITTSNISSWNAKQDALSFDSIPTENSDNLVKSGPLYTVLTNTELVVATALNDLNERILSVNSSISEVYEEIDRALTAVLTYRGTVGSNGDVSVLPSAHEVGDVYVVSVAGTYAGQTCEVGDYIICKTSGTSASNGDWNVVNGENQVSNSSASLAAPGSSVTIATVDGTNITISTPASWTGVSKNGTLTGVTLNGVSASVSNGVAQLSLVFDSIPTENSDNLVKSGDIYTFITENELVTAAALNDLNDRLIDVEDTVDYFAETDPVFMSSPAATITVSQMSAWNAKQDALSFDSIPTENSDNLVKSGDLYDVIVSNERVVATALNDVNDRLLAVENVSTTHISGITLNGVSASVSNGVASVSVPIPDEVEIINVGNVNFDVVNPSMPSGTYASIKAAFDAGKNVIIRTQDSEYLRDYYLEGAYLETGNEDFTFTNFYEGTRFTISSDSNINYVWGIIPDQYKVAEWGFTKNSGTLTGVTLNGVSVSVSNGVAQLNLVFDSIPTQNSDNLVKSGVLYSVITDNELVVSTALNDLNDRVSDLESNTGSGGITGVMFNGVSASISNGVASISATIPAAVTESTVSNWGFTKNSGTLTGVNFNGTDVSVSNGVASITALPVSWSTNQSVEGASTGIRRGNTSIIANLDGEFDPELTIKGNSYSTILDTGTLMFRSNSFVVGQGYNYSTTYTSNGIQYKPNGVNTTYSIELPEASGTIALTSQIPTAVTESTISGWGFTKNTGTLTGISMNSAAVSVSNGVANLGTVLTSHQSIKTINSQTVTGTGDLTIREMPSVSSSDNGKVLQVVNGSWTLVTPVSIYNGTSNPDNSQGTNGDLYLQTS